MGSLEMAKLNIERLYSSYLDGLKEVLRDPEVNYRFLPVGELSIFNGEGLWEPTLMHGYDEYLRRNPNPEILEESLEAFGNYKILIVSDEGVVFEGRHRAFALKNTSWQETLVVSVGPSVSAIWETNRKLSKQIHLRSVGVHDLYWVASLERYENEPIRLCTSVIGDLESALQLLMILSNTISDGLVYYGWAIKTDLLLSEERFKDWLGSRKDNEDYFEVVDV